MGNIQHTSKVKRVGIYLDIRSSAGGMFQYSQSILDAIIHASSSEINFLIIYSGDEWQKILKGYPHKCYKINNHFFGNIISKLFVLFQLPLTLSKFFSRFLNPVVKEINSLNLDLIFFPNQDYLSFQTNLKSISTIHDLMHIYEKRFPEVSKRFRYTYREYRYKNICKNSAAVLVDSSVGKQQVLDSYDISEKNIFPLQYTPPKYIYNKNNDITDLHKFEKFIFYPAQFWKHKNHKRLLKAIFIVKQKHQNIRIIFTGRKNHLYADLKKLTEKLSLQENIIFLGKIDDENMSEYYRKARALIFPSFFGPTNIPPLEAIICDCPMAVSNIYAMPDQLEDAALYFDPLDTHSISKCIIDLWENDSLCESLIKNNKKVKSKISNEVFSKNFLKIIESSL